MLFFAFSEYLKSIYAVSPNKPDNFSCNFTLLNPCDGKSPLIADSKFLDVLNLEYGAFNLPLLIAIPVTCLTLSPANILVLLVDNLYPYELA